MCHKSRQVSPILADNLNSSYIIYIFLKDRRGFLPTFSQISMLTKCEKLYKRSHGKGFYDLNPLIDSRCSFSIV